MTYEIKKGIPIPKTTHKNQKYPFWEMEVGDCVDLDIPVQRVSSVTRNQREKGWKFTTQTLSGTLTRVWRIQ